MLFRVVRLAALLLQGGMRLRFLKEESWYIRCPFVFRVVPLFATAGSNGRILKIYTLLVDITDVSF